FVSGMPLEDMHVKQAIDEGLHRLGNSGRLVIRPSGTEPLIRIMAEGDDESLIVSVVDDIAGAVSKSAA
ncbi:MAG: phosphoglucosamine mutase, partial [Nitratireductor sp.]|nr:phosphoglucosamine mutase [Nitratireductor sp.]